MKQKKKAIVIADMIIGLIVMLLLTISTLTTTSGVAKLKENKAFSGNETLGFNFIVSPEEARVKNGETVTITATVQDIVMGENGLNNVIGKLSYDEDLFEELTIQTEKDWLLELNQQENHSLYGKFAIYTLQEGVTTGQNLVKFNFKLKSDLKPQTTEVTFTDLKSSDGEYSVSDEDKKVKIIIYEDEVVTEPTPEEPQPTEVVKPVQTGDVIVAIAIILIAITIGLNIAFWGKKSKKKIIVAVIIAIIGLISAGITTFAEEIDYTGLMNRLSVQEKFLNSEKYLVTTDNISRVAPGTTVEEFKTKLNKTVTVKNAEDVDVADNAVVSTGMITKTADEENSYEISVVGDLDADGESNQVELTTIIRKTVDSEKWNLEGSKYISADMNSDGNINIKDVNSSVKYIVYGELSIPTFEQVKAPSVEVISGTYNNQMQAYENEISLRLMEKEEGALKTYYKVEGTNEEDESSTLPTEYTELNEITTINLTENGVYKVSAYTIGKLGNKSEISALIVSKKIGFSNYTVKYHKQNIDGTYTVAEEIEKSDVLGASVTAEPKEYEGYILNTTTSNATGIVKSNEELVLNLYYDRNEYTLTLVAGENVESVSGIGVAGLGNEVATTQAKDENNQEIENTYICKYKMGQLVDIEAILQEIDGYNIEFEKWTSTNTSILADIETKETQITMPMADIQLTATGTKTANNYDYEIKYYYDEVEDETLKETLNAEFGTAIIASDIALKVERNRKAGYEIDTTKGTNGIEGTPLTIASTDTENVINVYYKATTYNLTYQLNDGALDTGITNPETYKVTTPSFTLNNPTKQGYTFTGWTLTKLNGENQTTGTPNTALEIVKGTTGDREYTANWIANDDTAYKVEHYKQEIDGTYTLESTEELAGTTGENATAEPKEYVGFTENTTHEDRIASGTIETDGSLVLKLYYDRNTYTLTLVAGGNIASVSGVGNTGLGNGIETEQAKDENEADIPNTFTATYKYGQPINLTSELADVEGYTVSFVRWESAEAGLITNKTEQNTNITMPNGNITLTAIGQKDVNEYNYKIEYYYDDVIDASKTENIEADYATIINNSDLTAKTEANVKTGYEIDTTKGTDGIEGTPLTISATEDSNVIKVYYKAIAYDLSYNLDGGEIAINANPLTYKITTESFILENPTKQGYQFTGWTLTKLNEEDQVAGTPNTALEIVKGTTGDREYIANWIPNENTRYEVEHYTENIDGTYTLQDTDVLSGTTGETVTAQPKAYTGNYAGFTENTTHADRVGSGRIATDGSLVLKLYYDRNTYTLTLVAGENIASVRGIGNTGLGNGIETEQAKDENEADIPNTFTATYKYGQKVDITSVLGTKEGYSVTFEKWNSSDATLIPESTTQNTQIEIPRGNVKLTATATAAKNEYQYTVEYYFDGVKNEEKTITDSALYQNVINYNTEAAPSKIVTGYKLDRVDNNPITIGTIETENVMKVYYIKDGFNYQVKYYYDEVEDTTVRDTVNAEFEAVIVSSDIALKVETNKKAGYEIDTTKGTNGIEGTPLRISSTETENVINVYYKATTYQLTYQLNDGALDTGITNPETYKVTTSSFTLNNPTKQGYTFTGWTLTKLNGENQTTGTPNTALEIVKGTTGDREYTANWIANDDTAYKVEHYKQEIDGTYTLEATEELAGTTGEPATAEPKEYVGFTENTTHVNRIASGLIKSDGSLVLKLYYDRNTYTLTLVAGENIASVSGVGSTGLGDGVTTETAKDESNVEIPNTVIATYKYGQPINLTAELAEVEGYTVSFVRWESAEAGLITNKTEQNTNITMPNGNVKLTAIGATEADEIILTIHHYEEGTTTKVAADETLTSIIGSTYTVTNLINEANKIILNETEQTTARTYLNTEKYSYVSLTRDEENTTVDENAAVSGTFAIGMQEINYYYHVNRYQITGEVVGENGTISNVTQTVEHGNNATNILCTPIGGYRVASIRIYSGAEVDGEYETDGGTELTRYDEDANHVATISTLTNITENKHIVVTFEEIPLVAKIVAVPSGTEAMVNGSGNLILNHEYYTLEQALNDAKLANANGGIVEIQLINNVKNESNAILNGNNIILDLNGYSVTSLEPEPTLTIYDASLVVKDNSILGTGKIESTTGIGVYITSDGSFILGEDVAPINVTTPQIVGITYGVYKEVADGTQGTFKFFDGKVEGNVAISGSVDETPLLYSATVATSTETSNQVGILAVVSNVEATIGKKTYITLADAVEAANNLVGTSETQVEIDVIADITTPTRQLIDYSKNIILDLNGHTITTATQDYVLENQGKLKIIDSTATKENPSGDGKITSTTYNTILNSLAHVTETESESLMEDIVDNGTYEFLNTLGQLTPTNSGVSSSVADGYIPIDLTGKEGRYEVIVNAEVSSQKNGDIGFARITDNTTALAYNDTTNRFIYISGTVAATDYTYSEYLEGGHIYYLHFGYRKDTSSNTGDDLFKINVVTLNKILESNLTITSGKYGIECAGTSGNYKECITNNSNLYIDDEQEGNIVPYFYSTVNYSNIINTYGNTQVDNINLNVEGNLSGVVRGIYGNGTVVINDGTFSGIYNNGNYHYVVKSANNTTDTVFKITGGTFGQDTDSNRYAIKNESAGTIIIENCTINYTRGINNYSTGKIIINDGIYNCIVTNTNASGEIVINNGTFNKYIESSRGKITINDGNISTTSGNSIRAIYSEAYINIINGTILADSTGSYAIYNESGTITIQGGTITSTNVGIYNYGTAGIINISGGTIKSTANNAIYNRGTVNITGGEIQSTTYTTGYWGIINSTENSVLNIGNNEDSEISTTTPSITGYYGGIYNQFGNFNYYDGIIKSYGKTIWGSVTSIPTDTEIKFTTENGMENATLGGPITPIAKIGEITYTNLQDAIDACTDGEETTIIMLTNYKMFTPCTISENKIIKLNLNGKTVETYNKAGAFANSGSFEVYGTDTNATTELETINTNSTYCFERKNGKYISNNIGINKSEAKSYFEINLIGCEGNYDVTVNANVSSGENADFGYATITNSTSSVSYSTSAEKFMYITGEVGATDYTTTLEGGKIYYLHIGYYNGAGTYECEDTLTINKISVTGNTRGKIISNSDTIVNNTGILKINGGTFEGKGLGTYNTCKYLIKNYGEVEIVNKATIISNENYCMILQNYDESTTTISSSTLYSRNTTNNYGKMINNATSCTGNIEIEDSYLYSDGYCIYDEGTGKIVCINNTISAYMTAITKITSGELEIIDSNISSSYYDTIYIKKTVNLTISGERSSLTSTGGMSRRVVLAEETGNVTINNAVITGNGYGIYFNSTGTLNIEQCDITVQNNVGIYIYNSSAKTIINSGKIQGTSGIYNKGNLKIYEPEIIGTSTYGIQNLSELILGDSTTDVSQTLPSVTGKTYGVLSTGTIFEFYDGIIKGADTQSISGTVTAQAEGYEIIKTTTDSVESAILDVLPIAKIVSTGIEYDTIQEAINACGTTGDIVQLIRSATIIETASSIEIPSTKSVIIDLNSNAITAGNENTFVVKGNLELIDTVATGKILNTKYTPVMVNDSGNLTVSSANIQTSYTDTYVIQNTGTGTITVQGGSITASSYSSGILNSSTGIINVTGGTITGDATTTWPNESIGIKNDSTGVVNISNGTIKAVNAIYNADGGNINITGGTILNVRVGFSTIYNATTGEITVNAGNINATNANAIYNATENGKVYITGGTVNATSSGYYGKHASLYNMGYAEITGGTVSCIVGYAIESATGSETKIIDGTITSNTGALGLSGLANISGGDILGNIGIETSSTGITNITGGNITGNEYGLFVNSGECTVNITGGSILATEGAGLGNLDKSSTICLGRTETTEPTIKGTTVAIYGFIDNVQAGNRIILSEDETYKKATIETVTGIAKIGDTVYDTVQEAIETCSTEATETTIIQIQKSFVLTGDNSNNPLQILNGQDITIDLNGFTIYVYQDMIENAGKVTITDSSIGATGIIQGYCKNNTVKNSGIFNITNAHVSSDITTKTIYNTESGTVTIKDATLSGVGVNWDAYGIYNDSKGIVEIDNSRLNIEGPNLGISKYYYNIYSSNADGENIANITINSSTIISNTKSIFIEKNTNVNITNTDITSECTAIRYTGDKSLNIIGGSIIATGSSVDPGKGILNEGGKIIIDGTAITTYAAGIYNYRASGTVTVNSGSINSTNGQGIRINAGTVNILDGTVTGTDGIFVYAGTVNIGDNIYPVRTSTPSIQGTTNGINNDGGIVNFYDGIITGVAKAIVGVITGTPDLYSVSITEEETVATLVLNSTFEQVATVDGIYFNTLQQAINAADSGTVVLAKDLVLSTPLTIAEGKNVKIDLAGYTITYLGENAAIENNGTLTIIDSDEDGIVTTYSKIESMGGATIENNGSLILGVNDGTEYVNSPRIIGVTNAIIGEGTLVVYDGQTINK